MALRRVAVVCDFREENWPSMDLVADMLVSHLQKDHSDLFAVTRIWLNISSAQGSGCVRMVCVAGWDCQASS